MPTQRRRIGFLPKSEVQYLIDKICIHNKLSQSKVTGILVEEALNYRGVLNTSINKLSFDFTIDNNENNFVTNNTYNNKFLNNDADINLEDDSIKDEVQMIKDYIEFKFFKNIMNRNKKNNK